ncbi:MAG: helix-turn-helix transcriptional regulator [Treponema sp.]|nr:helix-turn-helix transcriptional regulator [Treponema sp.]MEE3435919.1 helix-turn-helix transcriptional regulator [Treponema sp.]
MSDFWRRVDEELEYKGFNRAYLAKNCDFSVTNIGQGIKLGSTPSAETAVKIAAVLGVSVEYLVNGTNAQKSTKSQEDAQLRLYRKYKKVIDILESLPTQKQDSSIKIIEQFKILGK